MLCWLYKRTLVFHCIPVAGANKYDLKKTFLNRYDGPRRRTWWVHPTRRSSWDGQRRTHRGQHAAESGGLGVPQPVRIASQCRRWFWKPFCNGHWFLTLFYALCPQGLWQPELCMADGVQPVQSPQTRRVRRWPPLPPWR